ncbi:DUF6099 family protein [Streptacidiphilus carbonis]|uniref:DUF6099 family protein n=1 Tax=Streptacidiphilus carbonis TaxID=105422 RepID=UPI001269FA0A|nr:DUF6099 family protein [Streptacidiphilus carbonis]
MDALRLIKSSRHGLTEARSVPEVLAECWQACVLVEAVTGVAALELMERELLDRGSCGSGGAAAIARAVAEAAGHAAACVGRPPDDGGGPARAERLTVLTDAAVALRELCGLVQETAEALVVLACGAGEQELYWRCIDSVDAVAECQDLAAQLLRAVDPACRELLPVGDWQQRDGGGS